MSCFCFDNGTYLCSGAVSVAGCGAFKWEWTFQPLLGGAQSQLKRLSGHPISDTTPRAAFNDSISVSCTDSVYSPRSDVVGLCQHRPMTAVCNVIFNVILAESTSAYAA